MRTVPKKFPAMYVCLCNGVTERAIRETAAAGCSTMAELTMRTGCGAGCGSCTGMAAALLADIHAVTATAAGGDSDIARAA